MKDHYGMFGDQKKRFKEQLKYIRGDYDNYWLYFIIIFSLFCYLTK